MTRIDREIFHGWQAAQKGVQPHPDASPEWLEGYGIWLKTLASKRLQHAIANARIPPPPRRH